MPEDVRRHSPAAERNSVPICEQLQRLLGPDQRLLAPDVLRPRLLLEVASGTGQHAAHCSPALPGWTWQPSDADASALPSISAWCAGLPQVRPPLMLDVTAIPDGQAWTGVPDAVDAIYCANLLHISPWPATAALMQGAARHLAPGGLLVIYGPFIEDDVPTAASNTAFDVDLRRRNDAWGLRPLHAVQKAAHAAGLQWRERVAMPANNLLLAWSR